MRGLFWQDALAFFCERRIVTDEQSTGPDSHASFERKNGRGITLGVLCGSGLVFELKEKGKDAESFD